MNNTKNYTYTTTVTVNFEDIAQYYHLSKKVSLSKCEHYVRDYLAGYDDEEYYVIDNIDEIAKDLYDYLQQCDKDHGLNATQKQEFFDYVIRQYVVAEELQDPYVCLEAINELASEYWDALDIKDADFDTKQLALDLYEYVKSKIAENSKNKKKRRK